MRICGGCTACCTVLNVPEVETVAGTPCQHQVEGGCGIYLTRPIRCREWSCQWMVENDYSPQLLKDTDRPDKVGLVFHVTEDARLVANQVWEGAAIQQETLLHQLAKHNVVVVYPFRDAA